MSNILKIIYTHQILILCVELSIEPLFLAKIRVLNPLKKLAGQTVIYGLSSIVPKFLSYFLVPLHTYVFKNPSDYGVVGDLYGLVVMLNIVLTYGMETAYFY